MKKYLLIYLISIAACGVLVRCGRNSNTFSNDARNYGNNGVGGSPLFMEVNAIVSENCSECHVYASYSESDWLNKKLVSAGDPTGSLLMQRLTGSGVPGPQDMPVSGALNSSEIATIREWILGIAL